jgi:hypothetical protein
MIEKEEGVKKQKKKEATKEKEKEEKKRVVRTVEYDKKKMQVRVQLREISFFSLCVFIEI